MQQEDLRRCALAGTNGVKGFSSALSATDTPTLHVLVVADGDGKLSDSMRAYLEELFPAFTARTFDPSWYDEDVGGDVEEGRAAGPVPPGGERDSSWKTRSQVGYERKTEPSELDRLHHPTRRSPSPACHLQPHRGVPAERRRLRDPAAVALRPAPGLPGAHALSCIYSRWAPHPRGLRGRL